MAYASSSASAAAAASSTSYLLPGQPLPPPPPTNTKASTSTIPSSGVYSRGDFLLSSLLGQPSYTRPVQKTSKTNPFGEQVARSSNVDSPSMQARVDSPIAPHLRLPEPDSIVLARVTRVTSRQATCSILLVLPSSPASTSSSSSQPQSQSHPPVSLSSIQSLSSAIANHAAGEDPAGLDFSGVIRSQDVRLTETDKVKMGDCFRVGDLVRAKVISLGDSRSYFLSTASNHLGVLFGTVTTPSHVLPADRSLSNSLLPASLSLQAGTGSSHSHSQTQTQTQTKDGTGVEMVALQAALRPLNWQEMIHPSTGVTERRKVAKPD